MESCIFCQIVAGASPAHQVWQDDQFLAFLSIFPNTPGTTVVIPKEHYPSDAFSVPLDIYSGLMLAARTVGGLLTATYADVSRTGMVLEGFGIDHLHAKLFPLHGTSQETWHPIHSAVRTFFDRYPGYISSHDGERMEDERLAAIAAKVRAATKTSERANHY